MAFKRKKLPNSTQSFAIQLSDKVIASDFSEASKARGRVNEAKKGDPRARD